MKINNLLKNTFYGGIIFLAFVFIIRPLLHGGFFPTFDDVQVVRIDQMTRELIHWQFPVRYVNDLGNGGGYMLFDFYSPLVYYIGSVVHLIGVPLVKSTKLVFILGYLIGGTGIFVLLKSYSDKLSSALGTILFLTASYLSYDVYTRGSLAEFFAFALLPWIFWIFLSLKKQLNVKKLFMAGFFYALLIITHNITSYATFIFIVLLFILPPYSKKITVYYFFSVMIALAFSAFYWLPLAAEYNFLNLTGNPSIIGQYVTNFLNPLQVFGIQNIKWGIRPPILGVGLFAGVFFSTLIVLCRHKKKNKVNGVSIFAFLGFLLSIFLISNLSKPFWDTVPFFKFIQFPWRFLTISTVLAVLFISITISKFKNPMIKIILFALLLIPAITINYQYLKPSGYNYIAVYTADDNCSTTTWAQEYLPKWVSICLPKSSKKSIPLVQSSDLGTKISSINESNYGRAISFKVTNQKSLKVIIRRYYFPGWNAFIDGKRVSIQPFGKEGLIVVTVPSGTHAVKALWQGTLIENVSNWISLITFFAVLISLLGYKKLKKLL